MTGVQTCALPIWIVDYEYSGNNDPCYDLGDAINELELDPAQAEQLVTEYHGDPRPRELARARLWALMSQYGWSLWGSIRVGNTGDAEIREWGEAMWSRAVAQFESPEFERLLAALQARRDRATLWVAPLAMLADRLRLMANVKVSVGADHRMLVQTPVAVAGATFVVARPDAPVRVNGELPSGVRTEAGETWFWGDLPAGDSIITVE